MHLLRIFIGLIIGLPLTASASPWTLPRGELYAYGGFFWTRSQDFFNAQSQRDVFINNGTTEMKGLAFEGAYGLHNGLMISASFPILWYELEDLAIRDAGRSLGDTRVSMRWQALDGPIAVALNSGVKFPTATTQDPSRAQVGEGQYDFEVAGSVGKWFPIAALHVSIDTGYRWRRRNKETGFKPGNEVFYRIELGHQVHSRLSFNTFVEGFDGNGGNIRLYIDREIPSRQARRLMALTPNLSYRVDNNLELQLSASLPLAGKRLYAGKQFVAGIVYNRGLSNQTARGAGAGGVSSPRGGGCCTIQ